MLFGTNSYIIWLLSFSITHKAEKVEDMEVLKIHRLIMRSLIQNLQRLLISFFRAVLSVFAILGSYDLKMTTMFTILKMIKILKTLQ